MALILDKTLLRLSLHILSIEYLKDGTPRFTKVTKDDNTGVDRKVVENEVGKEDDKEVVTN